MIRARQTSVKRAGMGFVLVALAASSSASVETVQRSFRESVVQAPIVLRGELVAIEKQTYRESDQEEYYCGTNYTVQVTAQYRGTPRSRVTFATYSKPVGFPLFNDVRLHEHLLVLLQPMHADVDPVRRDVPDKNLLPPSPAHLECIRRLSSLRLWGYDEQSFKLQGENGATVDGLPKWLAFNQLLTRMPDGADLVRKPYASNGTGGQCEEYAKCLIAFGPLEKQMKQWMQEAPAASEVPKTR